jgi:P-type Ca2+ transporter type 2C
MENPYSKSVEIVAKELETDLKIGLSTHEAEKRLKQYGPNILKEEPPKSAFLIFASQFKSILITILIIASLLSFLLGDAVDGIMILTIVFLNALV